MHSSLCRKVDGMSKHQAAALVLGKPVPRDLYVNKFLMPVTSPRLSRQTPYPPRYQENGPASRQIKIGGLRERWP